MQVVSRWYNRVDVMNVFALSHTLKKYKTAGYIDLNGVTEFH